MAGEGDALLERGDGCGQVSESELRNAEVEVSRGSGRDGDAVDQSDEK